MEYERWFATPDGQQDRYRHLFNRWFTARLEDEESVMRIFVLGLDPPQSIIWRIWAMDTMLSFTPAWAKELGILEENQFSLDTLRQLVQTCRLTIPALQGEST